MPVVSFFRANSVANGVELWITDGTATGTSLVKDIAPGASNSSPENLTALGNGKVVFSATDVSGGRDLWVTDGSAAGTSRLTDIIGTYDPYSYGPGRNVELAAIGGGKALFRANDGVSGQELWITDGTAAGTSLLKDILPGADSGSPDTFTALGNGKAVFIAYGGPFGNIPAPWITDGTASGTLQVSDAGPIYRDVRSVATLGGGRAVFRAYDGETGIELWVTDGTLAGTSMVKDIFPGGIFFPGYGPGPAFSSAPTALTAIGGGKAVFVADDGISGAELWVTDGTAAGTFQARDIQPGSLSSNPSGFVVLGGGKVLFSANDGTSGTELWVTDGTAAGTAQVLDIRAGSSSSSPSALTALPDGRALFRASDGTSGSELWITDGTAAGTARVLDIRPGSSSSSPSGFAVLANGKAVFAANDGQVGNELWITDGTAAGTARVLDIRTGSGSSSPAEFESAMINASPVLVAPLPDTTLTRGTAFTLNFATAFADADVAQGLETLSFSATLDGGVPLPNWLSLSAATGVLSGAAPSTAPASLLIRVAATDQSGGSASGLVTIGFRNAADTSLAVSGPAAPAVEGNSGTTVVSFTVTRGGDPLGAASASWSVAGSGAAPANAADFAGGMLPSGTVSFASGQTSRTIAVNVAGDNRAEPDETFTLTLSDPVGAVLGTASATATIQSDDIDTRAPLLQSNAIRFGGGGTQATLTFDEALAAGSVSPGAFAVTAGGQPVTVTGVSVAGGRATLALDGTVALGTSVTIQYTDTAGNQSSGVLQDVSGNDVASFSATTTRVVPADAFSGMAYHWKSHGLLSGVTLSAAGDGRHAGAASLLELRGLSFDANGDARFDVFAHAGTGIGSFAFDLRAGGDAPVTWTASSFATWSSQPQTGPGQLTVAGSGTSPLSGEIKLGSVVVDLAAGTDRVAVDVLSATVGSGSVPAFSATLATRATAAPGSFALNDVPDDVLNLSVARGTADTGGAISAADALAALKLGVGRNPNADPDDAGPEQAKLVSPYQLIAADVNGDGRVNSVDALAILKMSVGRSDAPAREWIFVREDEDFWNETAGSLTIDRNNVSFSKAPHTAPTGGSADLDFIGVLKGDVNGSWTPGVSGVQTLDPQYFVALSQAMSAPLDLWG